MDDRQKQIDQLVNAAEETLAKAGNKQNHTVGAAILTGNGKTYTAVNLYHFTGGPCAEVVALATTISNGEKIIVAVVAVGDNGRGVISPCGRCRQTLFDYFPEMQVVIKKDSLLELVPVKALLPAIYDWNEQQ